ncbi:hypothetical protein DSM106972_025480 [Dulcicalothrix desertica PCC 7102]|uniref:Uncharacterized protein n=1 Tax=Dulcicalothrix desertica PCC 7102 TaxID=232991 RepID=A0A3S1J448_9CYAN|nr:hypothetical protein [Dulcicalothrix desertica]RUT07287.1 hypothetical protein DSM106972_025480 [Dulcicalothrix desertica PCC 7102]TWH55509.1 hypothetical protein CAL7102_03653 [Dulcicalothrix desertica PCC 7102]
MNEQQKVLLKQWVEALRSGKYKKDTCQLKTSNGYCCMGVAVVVHPEWKISKKKKHFIDELNKEVGCENEFPPVEMLKDFGLNIELVRKLIRMNDIELLPFKEIADYIEKELLSNE